MSKRVLYGKRVVTPSTTIDDAAVLVHDGRIEWVGPRKDAPSSEGVEIIDLSDSTLAPGFIDIHIHGGEDRLVGDSTDSLFKISEGLARQGTTSFLPTLGGTVDFDQLLEKLRMAHAARAERAPGAAIVGIHLEGPFLSPDERARGSQSVEAMRAPSVYELEQMVEAGGGSLVYMTIAPELPGAFDVIEAMVKQGVVPSAGHTIATYEEMDRAIDLGLRSVCHTFNGMPPMHHRNPGVVGAALTRSELNAELIGDGHHVSPTVMRVLYQAKGVDGISLITDNTRYAGMPDGRYPRDGGRTVIKEGGRCWVDGGSLAGSVAPMNLIVRRFIEATGCPISEAFQMAAQNPAALFGLSKHKGSLEPEKDADIVALDDDFDVRMTLVGGDVVFRS